MSDNNLATKQDLSTFYNKILPYLGGGMKLAGPVGMIISYMGTTAPNGYLACDGTWYDIGDYPKLANWMMEEFESYSYFALSGETVPTGKFKVPDLRGEFLRGTGTNAHTNQGSGANVGVHQNGTEFPWYQSNPENAAFGVSKLKGPTSYDKSIGSASMNYANGAVASGLPKSFTSRPTNTSVLYCIKYEEYEGQDDFLSYFSQNTFRGKNLGSTFTDAQKAAIARGDFRDLWNGDYWEDQTGRRWRIVDNTEPFLNTGDANNKFIKHHLVVMPDDILLKDSINSSSSTSGGYAGTSYRSTHRSSCKTYFTDFFGSNYVATHREALSNSSSESFSADFYDCDVELPNEINMFGTVIWSKIGNNAGLNKIQFKLFNIKPEFITDYVDSPDGHFWLRDIVDSTHYSRIGGNGDPLPTEANQSWLGFRPYALITGE